MQTQRPKNKEQSYLINMLSMRMAVENPNQPVHNKYSTKKHHSLFHSQPYVHFMTRESEQPADAALF